MRHALFACLLAFGAVGAAGCNEYRYYDIEVRFNIASGHFSVTEIGTIQTCRVTVSGADSDSFLISSDQNKGETTYCPPTFNGQPRSVMGTFEYSSHAESGEITFTMDVWDAFNESDGCRVGTGSVTLPAGGMITSEGELVVNKTGDGCM